MTLLDKQQARKAFSAAAWRYDEVAVLQREIGQRMLDRLDLVQLDPQVVLDLGAGTGVATAQLAKRYPASGVVALDFALPMLQITKQRNSGLYCVAADQDQLPIADQSVDLVYSNASLQWSNDLAQTLSGIRRILAPGGLLMFTTFGPDTLKELRAAWGQVDAGKHVHRFHDMHDVGDLLLQCGFASPVLDVDRMSLLYKDVTALMRDLKVLGGHNVATERQRGLTGKGKMSMMREAYESFRQDGRLPASYEVIYGHAWADTGK